MSHRPISSVIRNQPFLTATSATSVLDAARLMKQHGMDALLVVEKQRVVGMFTERDVVFRVTAEARDPATTLLEHVMTRSPRTISPEKPLGHALHMMYEGGFRHVPVVDHGRVVGVVSARDAVSSELAEFETELVDREHIAEILG